MLLIGPNGTLEIGKYLVRMTKKTKTKGVPYAGELVQPIATFVLHQGICNDLNDLGTIGYSGFVSRELRVIRQFGALEDVLSK